MVPTIASVLVIPFCKPPPLLLVLFSVFQRSLAPIPVHLLYPHIVPHLLSHDSSVDLPPMLWLPASHVMFCALCRLLVVFVSLVVAYEKSDFGTSEPNQRCYQCRDVSRWPQSTSSSASTILLSHTRTRRIQFSVTPAATFKIMDKQTSGGRI